MTAFALALAGYVLLMLSNPLRESFRDGWRCIRRYPVIWKAWLRQCHFSVCHTPYISMARRPAVSVVS
jgi:hypothetical protein